MTAREALESGAKQLHLTLEERAVDRLLAYLALMAKWNKTYNLTAVRDPLAMVSHHLLDSLAVLPHLPMPRAGALADAGSGAGLPGIPLAIVRPDWTVMLAEANQKKAAFLRQATIELGLRNTSVHEGRVEGWQPAQRFAIVISRAFARLAQFARACAHLLAADGALVAMKGALRQDELTELAGWQCSSVELRVPLLDAVRHIVICHAQGLRQAAAHNASIVAAARAAHCGAVRHQTGRNVLFGRCKGFSPESQARLPPPQASLRCFSSPCSSSSSGA